MPHREEFLKFLCILKKRKDGGLDHYYNKRGIYLDPKQYLVRCGFTSWKQVYDAGPDTLEGFVACQMRPPAKAKPLSDPLGSTRFIDANYATPFDEWTFALLHQPAACPLPDWACIGELRAKIIKLLPKWAENHLVYRGRCICEVGMAVVALGNSFVTQTGGHAWAYGSSTLLQETGSNCRAYFRDSSTGFVTGKAFAYGHSRVELSHTAQVDAYGSTTMILWPGPDGSFGKFVSYGSAVSVYRVPPGVVKVPGQPLDSRYLVPVAFTPHPEPVLSETKGVNMPFDCAVD